MIAAQSLYEVSYLRYVGDLMASQCIVGIMQLFKKNTVRKKWCQMEFVVIPQLLVDGNILLTANKTNTNTVKQAAIFNVNILLIA